MKNIFLIFTLILTACVTVDQTPGTAPKEEIRKAVATGQPEMQACYEELLKKSPKANGKIVAEWEVDENGVPTKEKIKSSEVPEMDSCVLTTLKKIKFPPAKSGQVYVVGFPFIFKLN